MFTEFSLCTLCTSPVLNVYTSFFPHPCEKVSSLPYRWEKADSEGWVIRLNTELVSDWVGFWTQIQLVCHYTCPLLSWTCFWLCWAFSSCGKWRVGTLWLQCTGFSLGRLLLLAEHKLQSARPSVVMSVSCPMVCGTFPDQGSNPCTQHWANP